MLIYILPLVKIKKKNSERYIYLIISHWKQKQKGIIENRTVPFIPIIKGMNLN